MQKLSFAVALVLTLAPLPSFSESTQEATQASVESCRDILVEGSLLPMSVMERLWKTHRSWGYGIEILERTNSAGAKQWVILVKEDRYKTRRQIHTGQELLAHLNVPAVGDRERLDPFPLGRLHQDFKKVWHLFWPFEWFRKRHRLAEQVPPIDESAWNPSLVAKTGWLMKAGRNAAALTVAATGLIFVTDMAVSLALLGLMLSARYVKKLRFLYPPFVFSRDRGEELSRQVESYWEQNPETPVLLLITGGLSDGPLSADLMNNRGYRLLGSDEFYRMAYGENVKSKMGRFLQPIRRFQSRFDAWVTRKFGNMTD